MRLSLSRGQRLSISRRRSGNGLRPRARWRSTLVGQGSSRRADLGRATDRDLRDDGEAPWLAKVFASSGNRARPRSGQRTVTSVGQRTVTSVGQRTVTVGQRTATSGTMAMHLGWPRFVSSGKSATSVGATDRDLAHLRWRCTLVGQGIRLVAQTSVGQRTLDLGRATDRDLGRATDRDLRDDGEAPWLAKVRLVGQERDLGRGNGP